MMSDVTGAFLFSSSDTTSSIGFTNLGVANALRAMRATGSAYNAFVRIHGFDFLLIIIAILFLVKLWLKLLAKA